MGMKRHEDDVEKFESVSIDAKNSFFKLFCS